MNLWQKLTIDWPCSVGDWLWQNVILAIKTFLDQLTFRRIIIFVGILIIAMAAAQLLTADVAFVFAGDAMFYFEIATAVYLVAARGHARHAVHLLGRAIRQAIQNFANMMWRPGTRQRRNANSIKRNPGATSPKQSDDEPGVWGGYFAFAQVF
jgi:hypothetical protein